MSKWQKRSFILDDVGLNRHRVEDKATLKGNIYASSITNAKAAPDPTGEGKFVFKLFTTNKEYYLPADEEPERARWVAKLRDMVMAY